MTNIPFKRKLKHLKKNLQREKASYWEKRNKILEFFKPYGADADIRDMEKILRLNDKDSKRFKKLLVRIGKAAKRQNSAVKVCDLLDFVKNERIVDPSHKTLPLFYDFKFITDARKIPFYKFYKVKTVIHYERDILAISEDIALGQSGFLRKQNTSQYEITVLPIEEYMKTP